LRTFKPYNDNPATPFLGGAFVAVGDTNGDGKGDIVTGAGPGGGPHVKVFSGVDNSLLASFFAYVDPNGTFWHGGINVATADLGGDNGGVPGGRNGKAEIVTGVGPGGGPHVKVFDTHTSPGKVDQIASFFAYSPTFKGGVNVAAGFITNNRDPQNFLYADVVTSPGGEAANQQTTTTAPTTKVWRLFEANNPGSSVTLNTTAPALFLYYPSASFDAFPPAFIGGVRNTTADLNGDGFDDILVVPGTNGLPQVKAFLGQSVPETQPPAVEPTFIPAPYNTGGFPNYAYTPVFLNPPTNTQPNPDVTTGVFLG